MARRATQEERDIAIKAYQEGATIEDAGALASRSRTWAASALRAAGIDTSKKRKLPIDDIVRRYRSGESGDKIGADFGVSGNTVLRRLHEAGVNTRSRSAAKRAHIPPSPAAWLKRCSRCMECLHPSMFHRSGKALDGRMSHCRDCVRASRLARLYGTTPEAVDAMSKRQNRSCSICDTAFESIGARRTHVDHCHATGQVRALLCSLCNTGLGSFRDDPARLRRAARYIESHRDGQASMDV